MRDEKLADKEKIRFLRRKLKQSESLRNATRLIERSGRNSL